eukprot:3323171-Pyramimonas_sp.AAC.1
MPHQHLYRPSSEATAAKQTVERLPNQPETLLSDPRPPVRSRDLRAQRLGVVAHRVAVHEQALLVEALDELGNRVGDEGLIGGGHA